MAWYQGPAWYQNASAARGRVAFAINETKASFNRSLITNTRVHGNSFTSVRGTATQLRRSLRLERATEWPFDLCDALLFGPPRPRAAASVSASALDAAPSFFAHLAYSIQIEDEPHVHTSVYTATSTSL